MSICAINISCSKHLTYRRIIICPTYIGSLALTFPSVALVLSLLALALVSIDYVQNVFHFIEQRVAVHSQFFHLYYVNELVEGECGGSDLIVK